MPSPSKHRSPGGLGRLLASLCPARAGPLPVQTGFPTSLADLVVKNHGRLKKPKKRPPSKYTAPSCPPPPPVTAVEPLPRPRPVLSPIQSVPGHKDAVFILRPELLALGGVVALALLVIWRKKLVAAVTVASFMLFLLECVRSTSRPRHRPEAAKLLDLLGRGHVSPIREVEAETETPRSSCADFDKGGEVSNIWTETSELGDDSINLIDPSSNKKRSWRKLIAKKLPNGKKSKEKDSPGSCHSESKSSDSGEADRNAGLIRIEALVTSTEQRRLELRSEENDGQKSKLPFEVLIVVALLALVAGKLGAVVVTVLCIVFFGSFERSPCTNRGGHVQEK